MDNITIIKAVIDADRRAREAVERAKSEADGLEAALLAEREQTRAEYFARAERHIEAVRKAEQADAADKLRRLSEKHKADVAATLDAFSKNGDEWAEALFRRVLSAPVDG